jgi:hypothetical protein
MQVGGILQILLLGLKNDQTLSEKSMPLPCLERLAVNHRKTARVISEVM